MNKVAILLIGSALILGGCGFKQDPLSGQSDRLRDSGPKKPDKPPEKPVETRNLLIDRSAAEVFIENQESFITVKARSLLPEFDQTQIIIENIDEFPDAQFIEAEGKFVWKPRIGTTGLSTEIKKILKVRAFATSSRAKNLGALTHGEEVQITVTKVPEVPSVKQIADLPSGLREGEDEIFHVLVKDPDGGVVEPVLQFGNPTDTSKESIASYIEVTKTVWDPVSLLWTYDCRVSIKGEITNGSVYAGFSVKVLSGFGKFSPAVDASVLVFTALDNWKSTWPNSLSIKPGVETKMPFVLYNPKGEGQITITKRGLPGASKLECDTAPGVPAPRSMKCTLTYTPVGSKAARYESIDLDFKLQNTDHRDPLTLPFSMSLSFMVEALP